MWAFFLTILPMPDIAVDRVDVLEINHVHDSTSGKYSFSQVIFWRWIPADRDWRVVDWRMLKTTSQRPACGQAVWLDGDRLRKVLTKSARETRTAFDPELLDRRILCEGQRWKLSR